MIAVILELLPDWIGWLAMGAVALGAAFVTGWRNRAVRGQNKALREDLKNLTTAQEVQNATDAKSDDAVRADLDRWVRRQ